jgi:hypothetical protein
MYRSQRNGRTLRLRVSIIILQLVLIPTLCMAAEVDGAVQIRIDMRIERMHERLKITPAQEILWRKMALVMRSNSERIEPLIKIRAARPEPFSAIADLQSYDEINEVHAEGIRQFTPCFNALYDTMSPMQRRAADDLFRHGGEFDAQRN